MFALILALVTGPGMATAQQNVLRVVPQGEVKGCRRYLCWNFSSAVSG